MGDRGPRLVAEVDQRLVLRDENGVEPAVVIKIAHGEPAADRFLLERRAGVSGRIEKRTVGGPQQELGCHRVRVQRTLVAHMPVGSQQIEPAIIVRVQECHSEAEPVASRGGELGGCRAIGEESPGPD